MIAPALILASASPSRQTLLKNAGLDFEVVVSRVDEDAIKKVLLKDGNIEDVALLLAHAKAVAVSEKHNKAWVIGADQTLLFNGQIFDKPKSRQEARDQLLKLRGNTHKLETCVAIGVDGKVIWSHSETSYLTIRDFTPEFLGHYLAHEGDNVKTSVGGYKIEGSGMQFFEKINGDYFSILGLPMLPLLSFLRTNGLIEQ